MTRVLTKSDLLVETNKEGAFFYIRPDIPLFDATRLVSDVEISRPADLKGFYATETNTHYENITVEGAKAGFSALGSAGDFRLYDYTFFDTRSDTAIASAIHRGGSHFGNLQVLRAYADGQDKLIKTISDYDINNTDFFDDNNKTISKDNVSYFRDVSAKNFSDGIFDIKNIVYITNATISDSFRILRAHEGATIFISNSIVNSGSGNVLAQLSGTEAKIYYYNVLWDGLESPDYKKITVSGVTDGASGRETVKRNNIIQLDSDPLAAIDPFFTPHVDRYRAQISVNGDEWRTLDLPSDGWFGRHVGDTLVKIPDLGNGVYRIRAWAVDDNGVASSRVTTDSFKVTTSTFNYVGGVAAMDAPAPWEGTDKADRMNGSSGDDVINGGKGDDQISGNSGDDALSGGAGDDVIDGGPGADVIDGGDGDDILYGGPGDDLLRPGEGRDVIHGGEGVDTIDYSDLQPVTGGMVVDLNAGVMRHANGAGVIDRFTSIENVIGSHNGDRLIGTDTVNRLQGGRGDDVITGGSGPDVFVIDNARDFGADRITDFTYSDALWFTRFTDLGADNAAPISSSGTFAFTLGSGGVRTLQIGQADRWLDYVGKNAEGYHVYVLLKGGWPDKDILPTSQDPNAKVALPAPEKIGDTLSFAAAPALNDGYVINLATGVFREASADGEQRLFDPLRNVIGTASDDRIYGDKYVNRITGGQGDDVLTGGGGRDVFIFDNRVDFGADRITDFSFSRELWFTQFTDLGADNVARIGSSGKVWFDYGGGAGAQSVDIGYVDRWIAYDGKNAEGYHVYSLMEGDWPTVDILPQSTLTLSARLAPESVTESATQSSTLTAPTLTGASVAEVLADFSATPRSAAGYVIDLDAGRFSRADAPTDAIAFAARHVVATSSNDYVIGDKHANRLEGGQGADVLTGGGGADVFIFDNRVDFGADRITDFSFSRELWFTQFTDLGADNVARIGSSGKVWFDHSGGAGAQSVDIGYVDRWIEYDGTNAEGYHVYSMMEGAWPGVDILPL